MKASGIRLGSPALTTRGMGVAQMKQVAGWIDEVLCATDDSPAIAQTRNVVEELCTGALVAKVGDGVHLAWRVDPETPALRSDRFRVRQIVQNLVDNALRFTDRGQVSVDAGPHEGGVRLVVSDTGTGIDGGDLPYLFEPFRTGSRGGARSGTGCGLYLVKRFSESLGGRVAVASAPGRGTRFTIDLPLTI